MGRAPCCDKGKVKKGPWSSEEDTLLTNFIIKFGNDGNWISLPKKAGLNRCGKSCRLRWLNYLRPGINHGDFTEEEDRMIYTLYQTLGSRWSLIAAKLKGRTDNDVKNYWNTKLKRKIKEVKFENCNKNNNTINYLEISTKIDASNQSPKQYKTSQLDLYPWINNNSDLILTMKRSEEEEKEANHEATMSHAVSSSSNFECFEYQNSSSSASIMSELSLDGGSSNDNDEIWMDDLLFESFDDEEFTMQLEEKIIEMASLLDV